MTNKDFIESQKDCARMMGMSLSEYQKFCANVKVPTENENIDNDQESMDYFGISESLLKTRKEKE